MGSATSSYVYIQSEPNLWTTGFYAPDGKWHPDKDFDVREDAASRVAWLNGQIKFTELSKPEIDYLVNFVLNILDKKMKNV